MLADTPNAVHTAAIDAWWAHHTAGFNAQLIAGTRAEARLLNTLARHQATTAGHLTGPALTVRNRVFQVGDRIVLLANMPGQHDLDTGRRCRVDNGMIATITHIDHPTSSINIALGNGRHIALTGTYVQAGSIDHGYATTIHKAQGLTCDHIHVVGPAGLYREAAYVAVSRARHTAHLYATVRQAEQIGERDHTTGITLPTEHTPDPGTELETTIARSQAKHFVTTDHPNLDTVADLAHRHDLGQLNDRRHHINTITARLRATGLTDPSVAAELLRPGDRAPANDARREPCQRTRLGQRRHHRSAPRHPRTRHRPLHQHHRPHHHQILAWEQIKPIDHPEPAELTDLATTYLTERTNHLHHITTAWNLALTEHGIDPDEPVTPVAAIRQRQHQLTHQLRATPPPWLTWWAGTRPTDPTAAVVYDDHISALATWRDQHHIGDDVAGYGPPPDDAHELVTWRKLMDDALATRQFLANYTPTVETPTVMSISDAHHRFNELDALFATAPPDQHHTIHRLIHTADGDLTGVLGALTDAETRQALRRDWILEHWPHIVEHHQLTQLVHHTDPLAHWPTAIPTRARELLDQLARTSVDTPEPRTLTELDHQADTNNPLHTIRQLETELADVRKQLTELDTVTDDRAAAMVDQHRNRLRERARDLDAQITRTEMRTTLHRWTAPPAPNPEAAAAVARRINHLAHDAVTRRADWVVELAVTALDTNPHIDVTELHDLIRNTAVARERGTVCRSRSVAGSGIDR